MGELPSPPEDVVAVRVRLGPQPVVVVTTISGVGGARPPFIVGLEVICMGGYLQEYVGIEVAALGNSDVIVGEGLDPGDWRRT
ncbi:MAG: hypothetical protein GY722_20795 [bacterium]|nr:hypothetical protein [bacterium]